MGTIATNNRQITLFYHPDTSLGKRMNAYVNSMDKDVLIVDVSKTKVTGTQWSELAEKLNIKIADLINQEHPDFTKNYGKGPFDMEEHDWLKVLEMHPELLIHPIVINGEEYMQIKKPTDFTKFMGADSAGADEKNPL
ncbi:arsenate reductase family protein [Abyssalbus ytuae]|uniref:Arsenate reductase n=1 Tax=Abyssalbus ytuae TaxID=2926907 RepID=A0A9E7CYJ9_9FLAO|nr:hypothetical protein [Abyssalbus ytuae]UOB16735.1 hypothetical protein MQE35_13430 [Abyssalbus ytuae]